MFPVRVAARSLKSSCKKWNVKIDIRSANMHRSASAHDLMRQVIQERGTFLLLLSVAMEQEIASLCGSGFSQSFRNRPGALKDEIPNKEGRVPVEGNCIVRTLKWGKVQANSYGHPNSPDDRQNGAYCFVYRWHPDTWMPWLRGHCPWCGFYCGVRCGTDATVEATGKFYGKRWPVHFLRSDE